MLPRSRKQTKIKRFCSRSRAHRRLSRSSAPPFPIQRVAVPDPPRIGAVPDPARRRSQARAHRPSFPIQRAAVPKLTRSRRRSRARAQPPAFQSSRAAAYAPKLMRPTAPSSSANGVLAPPHSTAHISSTSPALQPPSPSDPPHITIDPHGERRRHLDLDFHLPRRSLPLDLRKQPRLAASATTED